MAVTPLFVSDMEDLKSRLRLSDVYHDDPLSMIDDLVTKARLRFLDKLGSDRVLELQAITPNENPFTDDERLRSKAEICEVMMVKKEAYLVLPTIFADSAAEADEEWNESDFVRDYGVDKFKTEKSRAKKMAEGLEVDIIRYLDDLSGDDQDDSYVEIETVETETSGRRLNAIYLGGSYSV